MCVSLCVCVARKLSEDGNCSVLFSLYIQYLVQFYTHIAVLKKETLLSNEEIAVSFIEEVICGLHLQTC